MTDDDQVQWVRVSDLHSIIGGDDVISLPGLRKAVEVAHRTNTLPEGARWEITPTLSLYDRAKMLAWHKARKKRKRRK